MNAKAMTISKVKNIIIMLLHAIAKDNISMVDHFLDDNLTAQFDSVIKNNIQKNVKQKFGLLNISQVSRHSQTDEKIVFSAVIRFCNYKVDRTSNKIVEGDADKTTSHNVLLHFKHNNVQARTLYRCPSCGAGLNHNATSICPYCKKAVDERYSEFVLTQIEHRS